MKKIFQKAGFVIAISAVVLSVAPAHAQLDIGNKIKNKLNQKVDQKIDKTIDESLDGKKKATTATTAKSLGKSSSETATAEGRMKAWTKYDFVPGDKVMFADNLANEEVGEFPSRWDLNHGNAEVAVFGDDQVINLVESRTTIRPLMKEENWLPETFTIEMDLFFESDNPNVGYYIYLLDDSEKYESAVHGDLWDPIDVRANRVKFKTFGSESEELAATEVQGVWRHVAISFNKRSLKVYLDEHRLINIPNLNGKPASMRLEIDKRVDATTMVKNVMIAEGGKKLYDQVIADGKIITYGIKFDVNQATIRPESAGTLAGIAKLMQEQPSLRFTVEGHTDSDGDDNSNMKLSQLRAEAVKSYLVEQGIATERLAVKGLGESRPIDTNNTPDAKAKNRRVEFVKL